MLHRIRHDELKAMSNLAFFYVLLFSSLSTPRDQLITQLPSSLILTPPNVAREKFASYRISQLTRAAPPNSVRYCKLSWWSVYPMMICLTFFLCLQRTLDHDRPAPRLCATPCHKRVESPHRRCHCERGGLVGHDAERAEVARFYVWHRCYKLGCV